MTDDAMTSFESLLGSLPDWIVRLETILGPTASLPSESKPMPPARLSPRPATAIGPVSIRPDQFTTPAAPSKRPVLDKNVPGNPQPASQKPRTSSISSSTHSGGSKRKKKRRASDVHYRGDAQHVFEMIVKEIAKSRNTLRKGKLQATMESLNRTSSSSASDEDIDNDDDERDPTLTSKGFPGIPSRPVRATLFGRKDRTYIFDQVDRHLEQGQILVEKAAFRILREGQCRTELVCARDHFRAAASAAETEVQRLRKKRLRSTTTGNDNAVEGTTMPTIVVQSTPISQRPIPSSEIRLEVDLDADQTPSSDDEHHLPMLEPRNLISLKRRATSAELRQRTAAGMM